MPVDGLRSGARSVSVPSSPCGCRSRWRERLNAETDIYVDMDTDNLTRQQAGSMTSPPVIDLDKSYSRPSGATVPVPVLARGMVDSGDTAEAGSRSRGIAVSKTRWTQLSATSGRA